MPLNHTSKTNRTIKHTINMSHTIKSRTIKTIVP